MALYCRYRNHSLDSPLTIFQGRSQEVLLTAGIFGGLVVISVPAFRYLTGEIENTEIQTQEWPFHENTVSGLQTDESRHWEPISGKVLDILPSAIFMTDDNQGCLARQTKETNSLRST